MDILSQLVPCAWRGFNFPIEMVSEKGGQKLAHHIFMDKDGAYIENMGRSPYNFTIKAYFLDSLTPGKNETWFDLFPDLWTKVRSDLERRDVGIFTHPLYGDINCQAINWDATFESGIRNGVIVDIEFIETLILNQTSSATNNAADIARPSTIAINLDSKFAALPIPKTSPFKSNAGFFTTLVNDLNQITNFGNQVLGQTVGKYDKMLNAIQRGKQVATDQYNNFRQQIDTAKNLTQNLAAVNGATTSLSAIEDTNRLEDAVNKLKEQEFIFNSTHETGIYTTIKYTTLANVAKETLNKLEHIMQLNPNLVRLRVIAPDTQVKYYLFDEFIK